MEKEFSPIVKKMNMKIRLISIVVLLCVFSGIATAQNTEVKITLQEQFFDALLEAVFTHLDEPSVAIKEAKSGGACSQTIRLKKEMDGVKTAVRFRQKKIYAPIAFEGNYKVPLLGCIDFEGWAEANIDLSFDSKKNALVGRAKVLKVNLSGSNGLASELLARFVQNSIDKKINPIEIIKMDKLSFIAPVQNAGKLKMQATNVKHIVNNGSLDVIISYKFSKGE